MFRYGLVEADYSMRLRAVPGHSDGPIYMLTLTSFRVGGGQILGRSSSQDPDSRYIPLELLSSVGASLCLVADVVAGPGEWDRVGVIRYPSRSRFLELADSPEWKDWCARKERRVRRAIMVGMVPAADLPGDDLSQRTLVEVWHGPAPARIASGHVTEFSIEGTYVSDGRQWSGARFTPLGHGAALPLQPPRFGYQAMLVEPIIERWS
ncbi:MAG: hypothetical protein J2P29_04095 [Actinobacteria bacterium]|nr:hypothetical protein [Actinomycetota bacterium]